LPLPKSPPLPPVRSSVSSSVTPAGTVNVVSVPDGYVQVVVVVPAVQLRESRREDGAEHSEAKPQSLHDAPAETEKGSDRAIAENVVIRMGLERFVEASCQIRRSVGTASGPINEQRRMHARYTEASRES